MEDNAQLALASIEGAFPFAVNVGGRRGFVHGLDGVCRLLEIEREFLSLEPAAVDCVGALENAFVGGLQRSGSKFQLVSFERDRVDGHTGGVLVGTVDRSLESSVGILDRK